MGQVSSYCFQFYFIRRDPAEKFRLISGILRKTEIVPAKTSIAPNTRLITSSGRTAVRWTPIREPASANSAAVPIMRKSRRRSLLCRKRDADAAKIKK